jgi:PqqD family protein of HPr-rel-A system
MVLGRLGPPTMLISIHRFAPVTGCPDMRLAKFVKFREEKFGGVLFETKSEKVFTLSPSAAAIVREINQGGGDEGQVTARLKDQFDARDGDAIEREVKAFVADLRQRGLIED